MQALWKDIYNLPDFPADGSQWDKLFADGETFRIGSLDARVMHSPGHTLASITYIVGDAAFVHDTLFQPDFGTARSDFPGGSADDLYRSIQAILALPEETRLFTGHDYMPGGRAARWESTVGEQKRENIHLKGNPSEAEFVAMRQERDTKLSMPRQILHALQVNMNGGQVAGAGGEREGLSQEFRSGRSRSASAAAPRIEPRRAKREPMDPGSCRRIAAGCRSGRRFAAARG